MKTSDIILLVLAVALIIGMLLTALLGRGSRHGYGMAPGKAYCFSKLNPCGLQQKLDNIGSGC